MSSNRLAKEDIRKQCEEDLWSFAKIVDPTYMDGNIHEKLNDRN